MLDGKKPVFVDHSGSVFVFPYQTIRFLELMAASVAGLEAGGELLVPVAPAEDGGGPANAGNGTNGASGTNGTAAEPAEADADLELDEDFLRRIREV
jgi:hypothetical protein